MKDFDKEQLEQERPNGRGRNLLTYCLERLYEDETRTVEDMIVKGLNFEELIGAMLVALDELEDGDNQ
jgi:hypothetical protein